jgi:hypothetical protein
MNQEIQPLFEVDAMKVACEQMTLVVVRLGHLDDRIGWRPLGDWLEHLVGLFPDAPQ